MKGAREKETRHLVAGKGEEGGGRGRENLGREMRKEGTVEEHAVSL